MSENGPQKRPRKNLKLQPKMMISHQILETHDSLKNGLPHLSDAYTLPIIGWPSIGLVNTQIADIMLK